MDYGDLTSEELERQNQAFMRIKALIRQEQLELTKEYEARLETEAFAREAAKEAIGVVVPQEPEPPTQILEAVGIPSVAEEVERPAPEPKFALPPLEITVEELLAKEPQPVSKWRRWWEKVKQWLTM